MSFIIITQFYILFKDKHQKTEMVNICGSRRHEQCQSSLSMTSLYKSHILPTLKDENIPCKPAGPPLHRLLLLQELKNYLKTCLPQFPPLAPVNDIRLKAAASHIIPHLSVDVRLHFVSIDNADTSRKPHAVR